MHIHIDEDHNVWINQFKYIKNVLKRFDMLNCKPAVVPADPGIYNILPGEKGKLPETNRPYRQLVGSIMYSAICTRPDISFACGWLSRHLDNYTEEHFNAGIKVLRYMQSTTDLSIRYTGGIGDKALAESLEIYSDSDWGSDKESRRSISGNLIKLGGGPVLYSSSSQRSVALSS